VTFDPGTFDVESLVGRRNDERWNRTAVGDILERMAWSEPDKVAILTDPSAVADPRYATVTYRPTSWPTGWRTRCSRWVSPAATGWRCCARTRSRRT
jgi:hypothetical protein